MEEAVPGIAVTTPGEFRTLCFEAAFRTDGDVARWSIPDVTPNYHEVHIEYRDSRGTIVVLWTREGDVALSTSPQPLPPIEFHDDPALMAVLAPVVERPQGVDEGRAGKAVQAGGLAGARPS